MHKRIKSGPKPNWANSPKTDRQAVEAAQPRHHPTLPAWARSPAADGWAAKPAQLSSLLPAGLI